MEKEAKSIKLEMVPLSWFESDGDKKAKVKKEEVMKHFFFLRKSMRSVLIELF